MAYNTLQSQSFTREALSSTKRMRTVVTTSAELYDRQDKNVNENQQSESYQRT